MSEESILKKFEQNTVVLNEAFHLHACRPGPINANEIYLSLSESEHRPSLKLIRGVIQPKGIVAKHIWYWTSGLPKQLVNTMIDNLILSGEHIYKNGLFNQNILSSPSDEAVLSKENFLECVIIPTIDYYNELAKSFELPKLYIDDVANEIYIRDSLFLQNGLSDLSTIIANTALESRNLPVYSIEELNINEVNSLKSIDVDLFRQKYAYLINKLNGRYESSFGTIRNELKSYAGREPSEEQLKKILERSKHKNPSLKGLNIDEETVSKISNGEKWIQSLDLSEILGILVTAQCDSIMDYKTGNIPYIDGKGMVDEVFNIAAKRNIAVIMQEFIREDSYTIYNKNVELHPNLSVFAPVCRTWSREQFPEYDKNVLTALKYLKL